MRRKRTSVHLRFLLFFSQVHSVFLRKRRRGRAGGRGQDGVVERRGASRARGVGEFDAVQLAEQPSRGKSAGRTPDRSRARRRNERRARRNARTTPRSRVACRASDPARTDRRARGAFDTAIIAQRPPGGRTRNRCCRRGEKRPRGRARAIGTRTPLCRSRAPCLRTVRSTFTDGRSRPSSCGARHGRAAVDAETTMTKREDHFQKPHRDIFRMCYQSYNFTPAVSTHPSDFSTLAESALGCAVMTGCPTGGEDARSHPSQQQRYATRRFSCWSWLILAARCAIAP